MNTNELFTALEELKSLCPRAIVVLDNIRIAITKIPTWTPAKPVVYKQPDLPGFEVASACHIRHGDIGFEDKPNPARQIAGQRGGLKSSGPLGKVDRRPKGTVNFKSMTIKEKRRYWRWLDARKACKKAHATPPSWTEWAAKNA